jgi:His-Xaa-Ser system protein HxsD
MDAIEIRLDRSIFSGDVAVRTMHRYSGDYYTTIDAEPATLVVRLTPRSRTVRIDQLSERFQTDALDELMREKIRVETSDVHASLVNSALSQATPKDKGGRE